MMKALVLGAGASKSYGQSPTRCRMPVVKDFFRTFRQLRISENPWVLIGDILNVAKRDKGIDFLEFFDSGIDIEEFHSHVEHKLVQSPSESEEVLEKWVLYSKAYNQLIFLFASVVNEIQNGPVSRPHTNLARTLSADDVIITFNWDTLMDRALSEVSGWKCDQGYGITPKKIFRNEWKRPTESRARQGPHLIKLHGSSNWLTSYLIIDPTTRKRTLTQVSSPETLYVYECSQEPYPAYDGRYTGGYQPFSYGYYPPNIDDDPGKSVAKGHILLRVTPRYPWSPPRTSVDEGLVSMPLIVPPVKNKDYDLFGRLFRILWKKAEDAIMRANEIIIIGYSFPRTDHKSNDLFRDAFARRTAPPRIAILDPEPEKVVQKFGRQFGVPDENLAVFKECFSEGFDLATVFEDDA